MSGLPIRRGREWFQAARDLNYGNFAPSAVEPGRKAPLDLLLLGGLACGAQLAYALACERALTAFAPRDLEAARAWVAARASGPLVVAGTSTWAAPLAASLAPPSIVVTDEPSGRQVGFDFAFMATGAIDHLRALGHRRVAFLGEGPPVFRDAFLASARALSGFEALVVPSTESALIDALDDDRPSAWVVGGDAGAWGLLEACLARRGERLCFDRNGPAACGLHDGGRLALGDALLYDLTAGTNAVAQAVLACLDGTAAPHAVRLRLTRSARSVP